MPNSVRNLKKQGSEEPERPLGIELNNEEERKEALVLQVRACPEEEKKEVPSEASRVVRNPQSEYKPSSQSVASGVPNL